MVKVSQGALVLLGELDGTFVSEVFKYLGGADITDFMHNGSGDIFRLC